MVDDLRAVFRGLTLGKEQQTLAGHLSIPASWVGKTLEDLGLPEKFEVQVIGLLDRSAGDEQPSVLFGSELTAETALDAGDTILVYGQKEKLYALETAATQ
jgi:Trk K+ transport system NAD-binding subunit